MIQTLLTRAPHRPRPQLSPAPGLAFELARVHELCGRARRTLAVMVAAAAGAPVFWIAPAWGADPLNPDGMAEFARPEAFTFLTPRRAEDVLWTMEEVLRSGAVPLVVADLPAPPALTPVRRLHLAAETGAEAAGRAPLGLLLTPGSGGAPGVESRWKMDPAHRPGPDLAQGRGWRLDRLRARTAPQRGWQVTLDAAGRPALGDPPPNAPAELSTPPVSGECPTPPVSAEVTPGPQIAGGADRPGPGSGRGLS